MAFPADVAGEFETHVTVRCAEAEVGRLAAWAGARGAGVTHIVLGRGEVVSQPMVTVRARTTLEAARSAGAVWAGAARSAGFEVVRVKIEAAPWHPGVPRTDADAAVMAASYHFEHHVKVVLEPAVDTRELADIAVRHDAHLSHNARRVRDDGRAERFVTQRCRGVGDATAERALTALVAELRDGGYAIHSVEREFVVHDDHEALDRGWIDEAAARA